jgi:tripartite-type tricarboxylate transporter receptor subunit TctC
MPVSVSAPIKLAMAATAALLSFTGPLFSAESFPKKQVTILVPYAAGGAVDVLGTAAGGRE